MGISAEDCKADCKITDHQRLVVCETKDDAESFATYIGGTVTEVTNGFLVSALGAFVNDYSYAPTLALTKQRYGLKFRLI